MTIEPAITYEGDEGKVNIRPKQFPEKQLKDEATYLYRTFLFEYGTYEKDKDLSFRISDNPKERMQYVITTIKKEHTAWKNNWDEEVKKYTHFFPEGDPELYFAALDELMDPNYLSMISNEVGDISTSEQPEANITSIRNLSKRKVEKTIAPDKLN